MSGFLIRSSILDGAADLIRSHGERPAVLARRAGLPVAALTETDLQVSAAAVLRLFEIAAAACREPAWGLTLARGRRLATVIGPLWVLLRNARTVGQMCEELADNFDLYTDAAVMGFERTRDGAVLNWSTTAGQIDSEVQMAEYALALFATEIRMHLRSDWMPTAVLFRHAPPVGKRPLHRAAFGADQRFNQDRNALLLDAETLRAPLRGRGAAARALANRVVRLEDLPMDKSMTSSVESVVRALMPYAPCSVVEVGRALGVAPRTLQLRLQRQGTSFTRIRDAVRADLASKYLRYSDLSAAQIAEILGYTDATSFSRSFRRWNGQSVRQRRAQGGAT